jgi:IS5 family transposase
MTGNRVDVMKQLGLGLNLVTKKTRKREFLEEMEHVVPWSVLVQIVEPYYPKAKTGRPPFEIETMLRIHYLQQWFGLSDPAMEEALHDVPLYREFAKLDSGAARLPDETTILRFRHLLERQNLAVDMLRVVNDLLQRKGLMMRTGTAVDATLISAPSSTKNAEGERDPEMRQTKKGNNWYFGMKAHIGVDAHSGLVHTVAGTAANVNDLNMAGVLLHGEEEAAFGDAGYQGVHKRPEAAGPTWHVAMRPSKRKKLNPFIEPEFVAERVEKMKASIRAKVEHPFRVIKRQFGFTKVRYRGLAKNTARLHFLFALSNLFQVRRALLAAA